MNFTHLIAKTASPGPVVPVPSLGSWRFLNPRLKFKKYSGTNLKTYLGGGSGGPGVGLGGPGGVFF